MRWSKICQIMTLNIYRKSLVVSGDLFEIVKQEGVYSYDYMDTEIDMHLFIEKEMRGGIS